MSRTFTRPNGKPITDKEINRSFQAYKRWYSNFGSKGRGLANEIEDFDLYKEIYINAVLANEQNIARTVAYEQLNFKTSEARATWKFINESDSESKYMKQLKAKYQSYQEVLKAKKNDIDFQLIAMKISPDIWDIPEAEREQKYGQQIRSLRSEYEGALYRNETIQKERKYSRLSSLENEEVEDIYE